jgi:hypothetical protein
MEGGRQGGKDKEEVEGMDGLVGWLDFWPPSSSSSPFFSWGLFFVHVGVSVFACLFCCFVCFVKVR